MKDITTIATGITLHAQPYDIAATGFYFESWEEYQRKAKALRNDYGQPRSRSSKSSSSTARA